MFGLAILLIIIIWQLSRIEKKLEGKTAFPFGSAGTT